MFITDGTKTRNISASRLSEYVAKGYREVKTPEKPKTPAKAKK